MKSKVFVQSEWMATTNQKPIVKLKSYTAQRKGGCELKTYIFFDRADGVTLKKVYSEKPLSASAIRKEIDEVESKTKLKIGCKELK